jgi:hypothetical protein
MQRSIGDMRANTFFSPHHCCDSRFFGMRNKVFLKFARAKPRYGQNGNFDEYQEIEAYFNAMEYFLAHFLLAEESMGFSYRSLNQIPIYRGVSASTGKSLDNFSVLIKIRVANSVRKILRKGLLGVNA